MQAVILAGGFGTRLAHLLKDVPKPMAPIGDIPFLEYLVSSLKRSGITKFIFLTGHLANVIEHHFAHLPQAVFVRENTPLGTGGALLNAFDKLDDQFFLINGDTFFDIDLSLLCDFARTHNHPHAILSLRYCSDPTRYGLVDIDTDYHVHTFNEKGALPPGRIDGWMNGGICLFDKRLLQTAASSYRGTFISLENELFPYWATQHQLYGLPVGGFFIDIGIPQDFHRAQTEISAWIKKPGHPALFIDKDGTLIANTHYPHGPKIQPLENTLPILRNYIQQNYWLVMITNQAGIAKGKFTLSQMHENIQAVTTWYAKQGVSFDDIEYCPYHPAGNVEAFAKYSLARKPQPGMILQACEKLKIDLRRSVMLGDNPSVDRILLPYLESKLLGD